MGCGSGDTYDDDDVYNKVKLNKLDGFIYFV